MPVTRSQTSKMSKRARATAFTELPECRCKSRSHALSHLPRPTLTLPTSAEGLPETEFGESFLNMVLHCAKEDFAKTMRFLVEYWPAILRITLDQALRQIKVHNATQDEMDAKADAAKAEREALSAAVEGKSSDTASDTASEWESSTDSDEAELCHYWVNQLKDTYLGSISCSAMIMSDPSFTYEMKEMFMRFVPGRDRCNWKLEGGHPGLDVFAPCSSKCGHRVPEQRVFLDRFTPEQFIAGLQHMQNWFFRFGELQEISGSAYAACMLIYTLHDFHQTIRNVTTKFRSGYAEMEFVETVVVRTVYRAFQGF